MWANKKDRIKGPFIHPVAQPIHQTRRERIRGSQVYHVAGDDDCGGVKPSLVRCFDVDLACAHVGDAGLYGGFCRFIAPKNTVQQHDPRDDVWIGHRHAARDRRPH